MRVSKVWMRLALLALLGVTPSGCCILTYCGPPEIGAPCDAGGGCPGTDVCDTRLSSAGYCTRPCTTAGYMGACAFSGDTGDGYCGIPSDDGGLQCTAVCTLTGARAGCPTGQSCLDLDGGALAGGGSGICL